MRVLVVEDNGNLLLVTTRVLTRRGHQVCPALNLTQARACLAREQPDAAIIDLILWGEDGEDFADEVRANYPHVRLVCVTGSGREPVAFDLVLRKPYTLAELVAVLEDA